MDIVDIIRGKLGKYSIIKRALTPINIKICEYRRKKRSKNFQRYRDSLFIEIIEIFQSENINYWVEFGTLLGIYRDHGFIPGDDDFDFGAYVEDAERIRDIFTKRNYTLLKEYEAVENPEIKEMTFICDSNGITFDVFYFTKSEKYNSCYIFALKDVDIISKKKYYKVKQYDFPRFELDTIDFMNEKINVPSNIIEHLEYSYGNSFMIPDPHFNTIHFDFMTGIVAIDKCED